MATTADLMGLGMPAALAGRLGNNVTALAGIGIVQTGAAAIKTGVTVAAPTAGNTAFILDSTGATTRIYFFWNASASQTAIVFPPSGGNINGGAANASVSVAPLSGVIFQLSSGSGVPAEVWWALFGGASAANLVALTQYNAIATNTPATLTGAQIAGAADVTIDMTAALAGAGALNTPTAAQIVAAIPNAQPGFAYNLRIINNSSGAFAWTLTAGSGVTLNGTMTIAQNAFRDFYVAVTSLTAVAIQNVSP